MAGPDWAISSDAARRQVTGDARDHRCEAEVWSLVHRRLSSRVSRGLPVILDATNVNPAHLAESACVVRAAGGAPGVLRLDVPPALVRARNAARARPVPESVMDAMVGDFARHCPSPQLARVVGGPVFGDPKRALAWLTLRG